jgi:uncharacterized protein YlxP (DUF503 family)
MYTGDGGNNHMIMSLDKNNLKTLRSAMESALEQVTKQYGVKFSVGSARFSPETATFKVEVATVSTDGAVNTKKVAEFKRYCNLYDLKEEHLGVYITYNRTQYKISGLSPGSWRFPILADRVSDGKTFKLPTSAVASLTGKSSVVSPSFGTCQNGSVEGTSCTNFGTERRKIGGKVVTLCKSCAILHDEAMAELKAEAAGS